MKKKAPLANRVVMKWMVSPPPFVRVYMWRSNLGLMAFWRLVMGSTLEYDFDTLLMLGRKLEPIWL